MENLFVPVTLPSAGERRAVKLKDSNGGEREKSLRRQALQQHAFERRKKAWETMRTPNVSPVEDDLIINPG